MCKVFEVLLSILYVVPLVFKLKDIHAKPKKQQETQSDQSEAAVFDDDDDNKCITVTMETEALAPLDKALTVLDQMVTGHLKSITSSYRDDLVKHCNIMVAVYGLALKVWT